MIPDLQGVVVSVVGGIVVSVVAGLVVSVVAGLVVSVVDDAVCTLDVVDDEGFFGWLPERPNARPAPKPAATSNPTTARRILLRLAPPGGG